MKELPADWQARWPDFAPEEVACRGCAPGRPCHRFRYAVEPEAMDTLQALRNSFQQPMIINSAYRCPYHNAMVGGAPRSRHKVGDAFDVSVAGYWKDDRLMLAELAEAVGFTGLGCYGSFLHIDLGRRRQWTSKAGVETWGT